ncbi:MAG: hypothetical protein H6719_16540 [Sandaracinaceae bacterium]|nr:hypothetical protein [Sandaracinaceae bacterium]
MTGRRDFLETTAWGTVLGSLASGGALAGCGGAQHTLPNRDADRLLGRLERGLEALRSSSTSGEASSDDAFGELIRLGVQALTVADVARSIPPDVAVPRPLAEAVIRELPTLDRCVMTYSTLIAGAPRETRRNIDRRVREEPDLVMRIAEHIDARAAEHEISHESRLRLRQITTNVNRRMQRQSVGALADETVAKVERVVAVRGGSLSFARRARTDALVSAIWQQVDGGPPGGGAASALTVPTPPSTPTARLGRLQPGPVVTDGAPSGGELRFDYDNGDTFMIAGGVMLGVGPVVFGLAALIGFLGFASPWGAIIGATPGGVLVIVGIVHLVIGALRSRTPAQLRGL